MPSLHQIRILETDEGTAPFEQWYYSLMKLKNMHESLDREFADPEYTALYLNDALNDGSIEEFLLALRNVVRANQGTTKIASDIELEREGLSEAVSESGNPQFVTVNKLLSALGLQFSIEPSS